MTAATVPDDDGCAAWGRLGRMVKLRAEIDEQIALLLAEAPSPQNEVPTAPVVHLVPRKRQGTKDSANT